MRLTIACALALAASAAHAEDMLPGSAPIVPEGFAFNASLSGQYGRGVVDADSWDIGMLNAEAHAGRIAGDFGLQADLWGGTATYFFSGATDTTGLAGVALHANKRTADGLFGALVSLGISPEGYRDLFGNVAIEARKDFGAFTLGGQAGYTAALTRTDASSFSLRSPSAWYGHAIGRWFATDDLMLAGDLGYATFRDVLGASGDTWSWGGRIERKFSSLPMSGFLGYRGYAWRQDATRASGHFAMVGVSFISADETLVERYRGAAGLDDRNIFYGTNFLP
jgi:hypothetical protein